MAMLREASDRVGEILREHRRRVDSGEDPCAKRSTCLFFSSSSSSFVSSFIEFFVEEARRRRAQELVLLASAFKF